VIDTGNILIDVYICVTYSLIFTSVCFYVCILCEPDSKEAEKRQTRNVRETNKVDIKVESRSVIIKFIKSYYGFFVNLYTVCDAHTHMETYLPFSLTFLCRVTPGLAGLLNREPLRVMVV